MRSMLGSIAHLITAVTAASSHDYGSFVNPSNYVRMKFRYWLPDPSVNSSVVAQDIAAAATRGAGGIEWVPLYNYGGSLAPQPKGADWATYGFGTVAFNEIFKVGLRAAKDNGILMDFALGPNQGQGVPSWTVNSGLHWDLAPFNTTVSKNGTYSQVLPGWGTGELVGLVSAKEVASSTFENTASALFSTPANNATLLVLEADSLVDQTDKVQEDGTVTLSFNVSGGDSYRLFAYYQYQDLAKNLELESNTTGLIFDNGSYIVDHFSSTGAQVIIDFWENHILNDTELKTLLTEVGNYGWEDSIEIKSNVSWSPSLLDTFKSLNGYSLRRFLPIVAWGNNNLGTQPSYPGNLRCILDTDDQGVGYIHDFRKTLQHGYQDYLTTLNTWLNGLGLKHSAQPSYNLPMDMAATIGSVDVPECESLAFEGGIDAYRQFSGVANLYQKQTISNEMGANLQKAFALPLKTLLGQINEAFAGGINQIMLHGQSFTGEYYETTWPGYTAFFFLFSDSYSKRQPSWEYGLPELLEYIARAQHILHLGNPRTDVMIFNKQSNTDPYLGALYSSKDLIDAGYTYTYLSSENFNSTQLYVNNGVLAPEASAYKAIVVTQDQNVTLQAVENLQKVAKDGIPILLVGGSPGVYFSGNGSNHDVVESALKSLKSFSGVFEVNLGQAAEKLKDIGVDPRVSLDVNGTIYPVFRTDDETGTDCVFLYASESAVSGYISVDSQKTPYFYDTWTGDQLPLISYSFKNGKTIIPVDLGAGQTCVYALSNSLNGTISTPLLHTTALPANVMGYNVSASDRLALYIVAEQSDISNVTFSNGKVCELSVPSTTASFQLSNWTLTAEHWQKPENIYDTESDGIKKNTTHTLDSLVSWRNISGLESASGLGYYSANFKWFVSSTNASEGAFISLPVASHGARVFVNGQKLKPLDINRPIANISPYLVDGANTVEIVVGTLMWNYILSIYDELEFSGVGPALPTPLPSAIDTGLIGDVKIIPFTIKNISIESDGSVQC